MFHRSQLGLICVVLGLVSACGGTVSDPAKAGAPSVSSSPSNPSDPYRPDDSWGRPGMWHPGGNSFEVTFTDVNAVFTTGSRPSGTTPPRTYRLDFLTDARGESVAAMTSRWGEVSAMTVTNAKGIMTLVGSASASSGGTSETWTTLTLLRGADGKFLPDAEATGEQTIWHGDAGYQAKLTARMTIKQDKTAPESRAKLGPSFAPAGKSFPWDPIVVELAEPVDEASVRQATRVSDSTGGELAIAFDARTPQATDWAGVSRLLARATKWPTTPTWTANVKALIDREGTVGTPSSSTLDFLTLPNQTASVGFDDDVVRATLWGSTSLLGGGFTGADDPRCEAGGCLKLEKPSVNSCGPATAGLLARLARATSGKVAVRYRVLVEPSYASAYAPTVPAPLVVEIASEGAAANKTFINASGGPTSTSNVQLSKLAAPIDGYGWASVWSTLEADAPPGSGDIGVALGVAAQAYCGGPPYPEAKMAVLVESVQAL